jgi:hypothetical protein
MLRYYADNPEVSVPYQVLVADEQALAACIKHLQPNYVNKLSQLPLVAALSEAIWARSSAFLTFLRTHFSLHERHFPALKCPAPMCTDGVITDGLINFMRGALALGPVDGRARPVIVAGENLVHILCAMSSDGLGLAADVKYDPYSAAIVGLHGASSAKIKSYFTQDATSKYHITAASACELLKSHSANEEACTYMLMLVNGTLSAPVYVFYGDKTGGMAEAKRRYEKVMTSCQRCLKCVMAHADCDGGADQGCSSCVSAAVQCVKLRIVTFSTDRAAGTLLPLVFPRGQGNCPIRCNATNN